MADQTHTTPDAESGAESGVGAATQPTGADAPAPAAPAPAAPEAAPAPAPAAASESAAPQPAADAGAAGDFASATEASQPGELPADQIDAFDFVPRGATHWRLRNTLLTISAILIAIGTVAACLFGMYACFNPVDEDAPSRSMWSDTLNATLTQDGTMSVSDTRTYFFSGAFTVLQIPLAVPDGASMSSLGVRLDNGTYSLKRVDFDPAWRDLPVAADAKTASSTNFFSYDQDNQMVYVFFFAKDEKKSFTVNYVYQHALSVQGDAAVLNWTVLPASWNEVNYDVTARITLPVPAGQQIDTGTVAAAGSGAVPTGIAGDSATKTVAYYFERAGAGEQATVTLGIPVSWVPKAAGANAAASSAGSGSGSSTDADTGTFAQLQQQAADWQGQVNNRLRMLQIEQWFGWAVSLAVTILSVVLFLRFGKEYKPRFRNKYWRDIPAKGMHPLEVKRVSGWNSIDDDDLAAELFHLTDLGYLRLRVAPRPNELKNTCYFALTDKDRTDLGSIDAQAIRLVFEVIGGNATEVSLAQVETYSRQHAREYYKEMRDWQRLITEQARDSNHLFEPVGWLLMFTWRVVPIVVGSFEGAYGAYTEDWTLLLSMLPGWIVMLVFSHFMMRRTRLAVEVNARSRALKRWLEDYTTLGRSGPDALKVWGELYVYAYLLDVAPRVAENLVAIDPDS